jgi:hypothetical protein
MGVKEYRHWFREQILMKLPIIVSENGDINIFSSCEDACSYLEPVDVQNGEYVVFDADGFLLKINVIEKQRSYFGLWKFKSLSVNIEDKGSEDKPKELIEILLNFLTAAGINKFEKDVKLPELVLYTENFFYQKNRNCQSRQNGK